jgi:hypothetical protein
VGDQPDVHLTQRLIDSYVVCGRRQHFILDLFN